MKWMNCMGCQTAVLIGLALVGGGLANLARSGNPETYLPWSTDLYAATPEPKPAPSPVPAPDADPPSASIPAEPETPSHTGGEPPSIDAPVAHDEAPSEPEQGEFRKVGFDVAVEEYLTGSTFVDARRTKDYVAGHITGAVSISPYEQSLLADKIMRLAEEIPDVAPVIVYCTASADCEDSAMISRQLQAAGFQNITIYKGGFPEWDAKLRNDERRSKLITTGAEPGEREL